jgi:DNA primase
MIYDLLPSGLAIGVAIVPAPHDPDSFIKAFGAAAFQQLVAQAQDFFDYLLNRLCSTNDAATNLGRHAISQVMAEAVNKTGDAVLIDKYAQKTALRLGVTPDAVRAEFKKLSRSKPRALEPVEPPLEESTRPQPPSTHEYWLLKLLLRHDDLVEWAAAHLDPSWVQHALVRQIIAQRLAAHANQTWTSLAAFLEECNAPEMQRLITESTTEPRPLPNPSQQLADVVLRLRNQFIDRQLADSMQRANQPECSEAERLELLHKQQELRQLKRQPI